MEVMKKISGLRWGANKATLLTLYKALIRTLLDYGCEGLEYATKTAKARLDKVQSKALALCCGTIKGTPVAALQVECGDPPLDLRRRRLSTNLAAKTALMSNNPTRDIFFPPENTPQWKKEREENLRTRMARRNPEGCGPLTTILQELATSPAYPLDPPESPPWPSHRVSPTPSQRTRIPLYEEQVVCYTDAAVRGHKAGIGIFIPSLQERHALRTSDNSSSDTAEALAVNIAVRLLKETPEWTKAIILTDSKNAVEAITGGAPSRACPISDNSKEEILDLRNKGRIIAVYRIPGHAGIEGNEEADRLARLGTESPTVDIPLPTAYRDIKSRTLKSITENWQLRWDRGTTGREFHQHRGTASTQIRRNHCHRRKEVTLTRLRMGHSRLNAGLYRLKLHPNGECRHCPGQREDTRHILKNCRGRQELTDKLKTLLPGDASPKEILDNQECQDAIFEFLRKHQPDGI